MAGLNGACHADLDVLAITIPHHASAIDTARRVLQHGRDPVVRKPAQPFIFAPTARHRAAAEFPSLGGTRGP